MAIYLRLQCDVLYCTTKFRGGYTLTYLVHDAPLLNAQTVLTNMRDEAKKAGWMCTEDGDYCPVHTQSKQQPPNSTGPEEAA